MRRTLYAILMLLLAVPALAQSDRLTNVGNLHSDFDAMKTPLIMIDGASAMPPLLPALTPLIHGRALVGLLRFQERPAAPATNGAAGAGATAAPAGVEPKRTQELTDLEDLAFTKDQNYQLTVKQFTKIVEDLRAETRAVLDRANDALVKACGLDVATHKYDFNRKVCVSKEGPEKK